MNMKRPKEAIKAILDVYTEKTTKTWYRIATLAFMAGMFIALGAVGSIIASSTLAKSNIGLAKFIAATIFPVGLMLVLLTGTELFTSNCMLILPVLDKRITVKDMFKNLIIVYFFNFLGCLFIGFITAFTHNFDSDAIAFLVKLDQAKITTSASSLFAKGILCNVLVCGSVILAYSAEDVTGRLFSAWFPIMLFVVLGYDHSIANMLYFMAAKLSGLNLTISQVIYNLFYVTLGNFVGGTLFMSIPLYFAHYKTSRSK